MTAASAITSCVAKVSGRTFLAQNIVVLSCLAFFCAIILSTQGGAIAALFFVSLVTIVSLQVVGVSAAISWFLACLLLLIGPALKWFTGIVTPIEQDPARMGASPIRAAIIFLIEDEGSILKLVRVNLAAAGFTVLEAENGEAALAIAEKLDHPIDLVVSDVILPLMSGPKMLSRLRAIHQNTRALFISGYPRTRFDDTIPARDGFLQKPFRGDELVSQVRALLNDTDEISAA